MVDQRADMPGHLCFLTVQAGGGPEPDVLVNPGPDKACGSHILQDEKGHGGQRRQDSGKQEVEEGSQGGAQEHVPVSNRPLLNMETLICRQCCCGGASGRKHRGLRNGGMSNSGHQAGKLWQA